MKQRRIRKRTSIRGRFLTTVLLSTIISILMISAIGILCIRWVRSATRQTLTEQLETNLKFTIEEKSDAIDAKLKQYENYIELLTGTIENMFADEEELISLGRMIGPPTDTRDYAFARAFASADLTESELRREILFLSNLETVLEPMAKENRDIITSIYLGTKSGLMLSYDRYSYLGHQEDGKELVYNYFFSEWYKMGMKSHGAAYTGMYMDFLGRGLTVTIADCFRDSTRMPDGVVALDFDLSVLYDELFSTGPDHQTFTFVLDQNKTIISPDSDTLDLQEYTGLTLDELEELETDPDGIMEKGDSVYVCVPMERINWTLCACVPKEAIQNSIHTADRSIWQAVIVFITLVALILAIAVLTVSKSVKSVTDPLLMLEKDIRIISDGNLQYRATVYRNDEIGDITSGMNEMVDRLNFTLNELKSAQQQADMMGRLATSDSLTGLRNKTAFDRQKKIVFEGLNNGEKDFGFAMVDLNNLKVINDNFGHDKGDLAIKKISRIICEVFLHSPVFRIGGDEFVVVLKGQDYQNIKDLVTRFKTTVRITSQERNADPWDCVSAAIGYALYDENLDGGLESVLARADMEMYECKKLMKETSR